MRKFLLGNSMVDAIQFTGCDETTRAIEKWVFSDGPGEVTSLIYAQSSRLIIQQSGVTLTLRDGDWLVREGYSAFTVVANEEFNRAYRPKNGGENWKGSRPLFNGQPSSKPADTKKDKKKTWSPGSKKTDKGQSSSNSSRTSAS